MYITPVEVKIELDLVEAYHIIGALTVALAHTEDEDNYNAKLRNTMEKEITTKQIS